MKLVTFQFGRTAPRAGVLTDNGRRVFDLQAAHRARYAKSSRLLTSVLAMAAAGAPALELATRLQKSAGRGKNASFALAAVRLLAPIPQPPQMRDFLCFEKHLKQGFDAIEERARYELGMIRGDEVFFQVVETPRKESQ